MMKDSKFSLQKKLITAVAVHSHFTSFFLGQGSGSSKHHSSHHESRVHGGSGSEADSSRDQISGIGHSESSRRTESR